MNQGTKLNIRTVKEPQTYQSTERLVPDAENLYPPGALGSLVTSLMQNRCFTTGVAFFAGLTLVHGAGAARGGGEKSLPSRGEAARTDGVNEIRCNIGKVSISGGIVTVKKETTVCRLGTVIDGRRGNKIFKPYAIVPSKLEYKEESTDPHGVVCQTYGTGRGTGNRVVLPKPPKVLGELSGSGLPANTQVTFSLRANQEGLAGEASAVRNKSTSNSAVLCDGAGPRIINVDGTPSPFSFNVLPAFRGSGLTVGSVRASGHGECKNVDEPPNAQLGHLVFGRKIVCPDGATAKLETRIYFTPDNEKVCYGTVSGISSYDVNKNWGPGNVYLRQSIIGKDPNGAQDPYIQVVGGGPGSTEGINLWNAPIWSSGQGRNINPCLSNQGWSGYSLMSDLFPKDKS